MESVLWDQDQDLFTFCYLYFVFFYELCAASELF